MTNIAFNPEGLKNHAKGAMLIFELGHVKAYGGTHKAKDSVASDIFMQSGHSNKSQSLSPTRLKPPQATNAWLEALIYIWNTSFLN